MQLQDVDHTFLGFIISINITIRGMIIVEPLVQVYLHTYIKWNGLGLITIVDNSLLLI